MDMNLKDYLTGEERRQMDALLGKAAERRKEKEGCNGQFIMMACQCGCGQASQSEEERDNFPNDMGNLFGQICEFCKKHNMCPDYCEEELPFP